MPTILAAADVPMPDNLPQTVDGLNFLPLLGSADAPSIVHPNILSNVHLAADAEDYATFTSRPLIWHFPHTYDGPPYSAIRLGDWKLIYWYVDERVELFNVLEDIGEANNLAQQHPAKAEEMLGRLQRELRLSGALSPTIHAVNGNHSQRE